MQILKSLHISEGTKLALIVIALYATIVLVTYLAW